MSREQTNGAEYLTGPDEADEQLIALRATLRDPYTPREQRMGPVRQFILGKDSRSFCEMTNIGATDRVRQRLFGSVTKQTCIRQVVWLGKRCLVRHF